MSVTVNFKSSAYARHASAAALLLLRGSKCAWFVRESSELATSKLVQLGKGVPATRKARAFLFCVESLSGSIYVADTFDFDQTEGNDTDLATYTFADVVVEDEDEKEEKQPPPKAVQPWQANPSKDVVAANNPFSPVELTRFWHEECNPTNLDAADAAAAESTIHIGCMLAGIPVRDFQAAPVRYPHVLGYALQANLLCTTRHEKSPANGVSVRSGRVARRPALTLLSLRCMPPSLGGAVIPTAVAVGECLRAFATLGAATPTDETPLLAALQKSKMLQRYIPVVAHNLLVRLIPAALFKAVFEKSKVAKPEALKDSRFVKLGLGTVVYPVLTVDPTQLTVPVHGIPDVSEEQCLRIRHATLAHSVVQTLQPVPDGDADMDESGQTVAQRLTASDHKESSGGSDDALAPPAKGGFFGSASTQAQDRRDYSTAPLPLYRMHNADSAWGVWCSLQLRQLPATLLQRVETPFPVRVKDSKDDVWWFTPTLTSLLGVEYICMQPGSLPITKLSADFSLMRELSPLRHFPVTVDSGVVAPTTTTCTPPDCGLLCNTRFPALETVRRDCEVPVVCNWDCDNDADTHKQFAQALHTLSLATVGTPKRLQLPFHTGHVTVCVVCPVYCLE